MAAGDLFPVAGHDAYHYVETGMYDVLEYGSVYLIDAERPAIVDTGIGTNVEYILDALDELDIALSDVGVIAPTHVHLDHAGGAGFLAEACPNAEVYVHEIGASHLVDPSRLVEGTKRAVQDEWQFYVEPKPVPEERITPISDGDAIDLGDRALEVHHAPGHAPHQVIYFDPDARAVFSGDAAGIWIPELGRVHETSPPPNFDLEGCLADVETIEALSPETICFGHFGPVETDSVLAKYAEVLTDWVDRVERKRTELGDDEAVIEHFVSENDVEEAWGERKARAETAMNVRGVLVYLDGRTQ